MTSRSSRPCGWPSPTERPAPSSDRVAASEKKRPAVSCTCGAASAQLVPALVNSRMATVMTTAP